MRERLRLVVRGAVQGVGFRPFVFRLAEELQLSGWVLNSPQGVFIEVEAGRAALEAFRRRLADEPPPRAVIQGLEASWLDPVPYDGFQIRDSATDGRISALVLPDIATCDDCRREVFDPADRRHRYPFTNCTNCGPRFSILEALPYDRAKTSMRRFTMCADCQREYDDPRDRRFHAQPNACPVCGPQAALWDPDGREVSRGDEAVRGAVFALAAGRVVAVKGLGGFHLLVDAGSDAAVSRLRARKHREEKPLALMYPDLAALEAHANLLADERRLLQSPEAPIVLVARRGGPAGRELAPSVAPGNPNLGVLLPYTPLHAILLADLGRPVVATSGNVSDEPICTDEREALERLRGIADLFLVHDRRIVRHVDDSIVRVMLGRELVLRRARGYAPLPIPLRHETPPVIGVGAHLKNAIAVTAGANVFVSQHIGDLETREASAAFLEVVGSLERLYRVRPEAAAADLHPDYLSTRYALSLGLPITRVQHHYAHVAACMADNDLEGALLGVAWDGTGYGPDGTVWGGEFLAVSRRGFARAACLRPFRLPGGDHAVREPRRSALGVWHAMAGGGLDALPAATADAFEPRERRLLVQALDAGVNAPVTTSAGRLFDAVASMVGLRQRAAFEGQAAMDLEFAAGASDAPAAPYPFSVADGRAFHAGSWQPPPFVVDWEPAVRALAADAAVGVPPATIAGRFHETLAAAIAAVAERVGEARVVLTGGCFQNRLLTERVVDRLRAAGLLPYWHQRVPPNDGGVAIGQVAALARARAAGATPQPRREPAEAAGGGRR